MASLAFVLVIYVMIRQHALKQRIAELEQQLALSRSSIHNLEGLILQPKSVFTPKVASEIATTAGTGADPLVSAPPVLQPTPLQLPPRESAPAPAPQPERHQMSHVAARPATSGSEPMVSPSLRWKTHWKWLEQQLLENWTGIVGSIVLVAGITFLASYAGLHVSAFIRFLMIVGAAVLLGAGATVLMRLERWQILAAWLRSCAAAVFLFACFASYAIPGIRWTTAVAQVVSLLSAGIAVNLCVAYTSCAPAIASLHIVLSLVPLVLGPQLNLTLLLATFVSLVGIALGWRSRWDLHTLITLVAYTIFHINWYERFLHTLPSEVGQLIGAGSALVVTIFVVVSHYRATYAATRTATLPLLVHLANWVLLASALAVYAGDTPVRSVALIGAALLVYVLAHRGKALGISWLYFTDTLMAECLAFTGIVMLYPFVFHWLVVPVLVYLLTALYLKLAIDENEALLVRISTLVFHVAGTALVITGLVVLSASATIREQSALLLLCSALVGTVMHWCLLSYKENSYDTIYLFSTEPNEHHPISLVGIGAGVITAVAMLNLYGTAWVALAGLLATVFYMWLANHWQSQSLGFSAWLVMIIVHAETWYLLLSKHPMMPSTQLILYFAPLILASATTIGFARIQPVGFHLPRTGIYLLGLTAGLGAYTLLQPLSAYAPGVMWLTLSLVALEVATRVRTNYVTPVLYLGLAYLTLFGGAYVHVVLHTQAYWGVVPVRLLIETYALVTIVYWWLCRTRPTLTAQKSWNLINPLFVELILLFVGTVMLVEVRPQWRPLAWGILALLTNAPWLGGKLEARFRFYSVPLYWASILDLTIVVSDLVTLNRSWYGQPGFTGLLAIVVQVLYLGVASRTLELNDIGFPPTLKSLARAAQTISARQSLWLYYPFFVSVALFLYWRFEAGLLTLLLSAEAFIVLMLSLIIRENHFRYMAMIGLAACVFRLVMFDMAQTNLGIRGLVFIGVGGLMLGMNSLYNRYKDRLL